MLALLLAVALSYTGAFLLRFDFALPSSVEGLFRLGLFIFIPVKGMATVFCSKHGKSCNVEVWMQSCGSLDKANSDRNWNGSVKRLAWPLPLSSWALLLIRSF